MHCPNCGKNMMGIEYPYGHPDRYDGVSEWQCCGLRIGRWSGRILAEGVTESRAARLDAMAERVRATEMIMRDKDNT